jgi:hypothetical protein
MPDHKSALDELKRLLEPIDGPQKKGPLPELSGVAYSDPSPGGERRKCGNCIFWGSEALRCALHDPTTEAKELSWCNRHLFGTPAKKPINLAGTNFIKTKHSGLGKETVSGSSCDNCEFYEGIDDEDGVCSAVYKKNKPVHIHPKGGCTRWSHKKDPEPGKLPPT